MPLTPEPLPEINDNVPAAPVTPEAPAFSLDAVINESAKAPDFKIVEDKVIRSDAKLPEDSVKDEVDDADDDNNDPQNKSQQDKKDEPKETKKTVADKDAPKDSKEDDEGGEDKSGDAKEETEVDAEAKAAAAEELKLHGNTKRDYTGFNDKQVKLLKRLDTGRFEAISSEWRALNAAATKAVELASQLEEQKKIAAGKGIPSSWYEHPEAYTLTPEFRQLSNQYAQYDVVENHYTQQMAAIQDGKPWVAITGFNPQTGEPIYSSEQQPSSQAMANVNRALMQATQAKGQLQGRVDNLSQSFVNNHKQAADAINNEIKTRMDSLHPEVKPSDKDIELVMDVLPGMYRSHPLAKGFAQMLALNFAQARYLKKLLTEKEQGAKLDADKKLAGPRGGGNIPPKGPSTPAPKNGKDGVLRLDYLLQEN
jgi:hypothetical protein